MLKTSTKFRLANPKTGSYLRWDRLQLAIFDHYLDVSETVQDRVTMEC